MTKKKLPVRFTGQHFTIDKVLIKDAIRQANISNQDTVLDIGAGKGFLTVHLLKIANNVVAIENDTALVEHLRKLFSDARNVQVVGCVHIPADTRSVFPVISVQSPVSIQCCWQS